MATSPASRPTRALVVLPVITMLLYGLIHVVAPDEVDGRRLSLAEKYTPRLALDLEGGTQIDLIPQVAQGQEGQISEENIATAIEIIRARVDGSGVAEAEVTAQGTGADRTILVSIPGEQPDRILEQVQQTAELRFRPVLAVDVSAAPAPEGTPTPGGTPAPGDTPAPGGTPAPASTPAVRATPAPSAGASPSATTDSRAVPEALLAVPTAPAPADGQPTDAPAPAGAQPTDAPAPTDAPLPTDAPVPPGAVDAPPEVSAAFQALDCSTPPEREEIDDPAEPLAACGRDDGLKYLLGPAELVGTDVDTATAALAQNAQGVATGGWEVRLDFTGEGTEAFSTLTTRLTSLPPPQNQLAIVLDGAVVSAPSIDEAITGGSASITGGFSQGEATALANVLRYGALPLSFEAGSAREVSPTLGSDSLRGGLIAGGLGLLLVLGYMLLYYRGLGLVSAASLVVAGILSWGLVVLLGWQIDYRLSLAGIAGLIVAIGITADSFVVYFERLRDEVREGKRPRVAAEEGWRRARRTILVSDVVSLLAAVVLYLLSTASVRGFAFTLGLTTVVDVLVVFLFTKPLVTLAVRSRAWGTGRWSGLDPRRLGGPGASSPSLAMSRSRDRRAAAESDARAGGRPTQSATAGRAGEDA